MCVPIRSLAIAGLALAAVPPHIARAQFQHEYTGAGFPIVSTFSFGTDIVISDAFTVCAVRVTYVGLSHGRVGDLIGTLNHRDPSNNNAGVVLFSRVGVEGQNQIGFTGQVSGDYALCDSSGTTFWDAAGAAGAGLVPPGIYHACALGGSGQAPSSMQVLAGDTAAGTWSLSMSDNDPGFDGSVDSWRLELEERPACYANCDGSTMAPVLNVQDFTCFLQKFAIGDLYANCDGSSGIPALNVQDFTCFLQKFAIGCP
jgi:subtilisin-like proprotein convertase family protein